MTITYNCNVCGATDALEAKDFPDACLDCGSKDVAVGDDTTSFVPNADGVAVRTALPFPFQAPHVVATEED